MLRASRAALPAACRSNSSLRPSLSVARIVRKSTSCKKVLRTSFVTHAASNGVNGKEGRSEGVGSDPEVVIVETGPRPPSPTFKVMEIWEISEKTTPLEEEEVKVHATSEPSGGVVGHYVHWGLSLGALYIANKGLASATAAAGVKFPSALIGMFIIIGALLVVEGVFSKSGVDKVMDAFAPALNWIQRWLPLFYVPSLVIIPLALQGIAGADLAKILGIIAVGMPATLVVTASIAVAIRNATNTEMEAQPPPKQLPPFTRSHYLAWGAIGAASFAVAALDPAGLGAAAGVPFLLAATVGGYLVGVALPPSLTSVIHPLITCALVANLGAFALGAVSGTSYDAALHSYLTKGAGPMGAGDLLMSFLGVVILSFGFKIYGQRRLMVRHAPEIFGSTILSAAFSMFSTAAVARALHLAPDLALALVPRSVTVALALPIAAQFNAPAAITAAGVVLTGLLGANFAQLLLNQFGFRDPIARGLATAGSAHGLGTAALARKEPEALPFCALAYALIGVISTVLASVPIVSSAIIAIVG